MSKTEIENTLGYALHSSAFMMKQAIKLLIAQQQYQTTPEAFFILNLIPENGIEQQTLVQKTHKDKAAVTRLLDKLTTEKWIVRRVIPKNKRKTIIRLSPDGLIVRQQLNQTLAAISGKMIKGIPTNDLKTTTKVLRMLNENLTTLTAELAKEPIETN